MTARRSIPRTARAARRVHDEHAFLPVADEYLVVCPRCDACAVVAPCDAAAAAKNLLAPRRLVCRRCGLTRDWEGNTWVGGADYGPALDPYFRLPLWLQAPCRGRTLWAYNLAHLNYVEAHVAADLRQTRWGLASRLPRWVVLRKNRDEVLRAVAKLKEKAPAA